MSLDVFRLDEAETGMLDMDVWESLGLAMLDMLAAGGE